MPMSEFGKVLRKLRIDFDLTLKEMADSIGVTSAYLSAVENDRKPLTSDLVNNVILYLSHNQKFTDARRDELVLSSSSTIREVRVRVNNPEQLEVAMMFARSIASGDIRPDVLHRLKEDLHGGTK